MLYIDNTYFEQMVSPIYPSELQLNISNSIDTESPIFGLGLVLDLSIINGIVSSQIYDK